jgi:UDP:flavonoid glycosyltransferase YjiC (YdhE family)
MARFAFVVWDGAGNVPVTLAIARALIESGHSVDVLGPSSLRPAVENIGARFEVCGIVAPTDPALRAQYLQEIVGSTSLGATLQSAVARLEPDGLVIDCNLSWAIDPTRRTKTAILVHTALGVYLPAWQRVIDAANVKRRSEGEPPLPDAVQAWSSGDALIVASFEHFDRRVPMLTREPRYVGLVRPKDDVVERAFDRDPPDRPLVAISYSTDALQNGPRRLQAALDAVSVLDVRAVATTSSAFSIDDLRIPPNAQIVEFMPHEHVFPRASVVIGHGGHGTTLAALSCGVPTVCVPGLGRDQEPIARRVEELGLGVMIASEADAGGIGRAVQKLLADTAYKQRCSEFARRCESGSGAERAAAFLDAMIT